MPLFVSQLVRPSVRPFVAKIKKPSSRGRILPKFFWGVPGTMVTIMTPKNLNPNGFTISKVRLALNAQLLAESKMHLPVTGLGQFFGGGTWDFQHKCGVKKP